MTIFQPKVRRITIAPGMIITAGLIVVMALVAISLYSAVVNIRASLERAEVALHDLEAANADLKNALYGILDSKQLTRVADELSLIKDNTPEYLETPWAFASQL